MTMIALFLQIFWCFFVIGLFNFGGGGAMISLIQNQVVGVHAWVSEATFTDIIAISQTTPGPIGINCATYIGYEVMHAAGYSGLSGIIGSAIATFAVVLPSFLIFFALMKIFDRFHEDPRFTTMMSALKPAVAGLIAAACIILCFHIDMHGIIPDISVIGENFPDWKSWALFAGAFVATYFIKVNPIYVILSGAVLGLILYI